MFSRQNVPFALSKKSPGAKKLTKPLKGNRLRFPFNGSMKPKMPRSREAFSPIAEHGWSLPEATPLIGTTLLRQNSAPILNTQGSSITRATNKATYIIR